MPLVHRNYMGAPTQIRLHENNFSIWNDGILPDGITEEDLKSIHPSKPQKVASKKTGLIINHLHQFHSTIDTDLIVNPMGMVFHSL